MISIGAISYGAAALAFALLSILLAVSWRGRRAGGLFILASAVTSLWALALALLNQAGSLLLVVYFLETVRNAAWLFALTVVAATVAPRWLLNSARVLAVLAVVAAIGLPMLAANGIALGDPLLNFSRAGLLVALLGLALLEQIYRNSSDAARAGLKFLVFGLGSLFAYDLFLYSQAELLRGITLDAWQARGMINALSVPLIAIAARRSPQWSLDVFVSRQVVFYTTTFVGVGAYLLLMAIGGYYVREMGGHWGRIGQILFFTGAMVILIFLVGSAALRRHTRVFISKHFFRNKYDYRIEWLRFIGTLSGADADVRHTSLRAIAQLISSPAGVLFKLDEPGKRFTPAAAWPMRVDECESVEDIGLEEDLPRFLERTKWIVDLDEYRERRAMYDDIVLPRWVLERSGARLISPILQLNTLVGFVLLHSPPAPFELTYEDRDLLKTVGRHVGTHLAQHEADRKLAESEQFQAYNRLTAFLMHDLKNSVAQLKLLVANAERHKHNPEFIEDAIGTIANTVERMTRLIEQLTAQSNTTRLSEVELGRLAVQALARCSDRRPIPTLAGEAHVIVKADPDRLAAVIEHVIRNAQDASTETADVQVELTSDEEYVTLAVSDTGKGMQPEFVRERLFRPFDSTKGSKGMGIGAYQVREYVRTLGGVVEVQSSPGKGTRFSIRLPRLQKASASTLETTNEKVAP